MVGPVGLEPTTYGVPTEGATVWAAQARAGPAPLPRVAEDEVEPAPLEVSGPGLQGRDAGAGHVTASAVHSTNVQSLNRDPDRTTRLRLHPAKTQSVNV